MLTSFPAPATIPPRVGVGLKPEHYEAILATRPDIGWFEVHAENYMGAGGPPHRYLTAIRELYPLSLHGVGLSIGAARPLDRDHLLRLKALNERYQPGLFSEHLAWSTHDSVFFSDLLPIPYDAGIGPAGRRPCRRGPGNRRAPDAAREPLDLRGLRREHASARSISSTEVAQRTGCGLLLDVNNVHVSCTNQRWDAIDYINRFPMQLVGEIHMAGYAPERGRSWRSAADRRA